MCLCMHTRALSTGLCCFLTNLSVKFSDVPAAPAPKKAAVGSLNFPLILHNISKIMTTDRDRDKPGAHGKWKRHRGASHQGLMWMGREGGGGGVRRRGEAGSEQIRQAQPQNNFTPSKSSNFTFKSKRWVEAEKEEEMER